MGRTKIAKQLTDYYRSTLDNTMSISKQYREGMSNLFTGKSFWVSGEGKTLIGEWTKAYKKGFDDFRLATKDPYKKFEPLFNPGTRFDSVNNEKAKKSKLN